MKKIALLPIIVCFFLSATYAQDKASDLKKLCEVMKSEEMVDGMFSNILPMVEQLSGDTAQGKYNQCMDYLAEAKVMYNKLFNEEMSKIYDKYFSHEEIKNLVAFYESSTGQKMLRKTPEMTKDLMEIMIYKYMPEIQKKIMEINK